MFLFFCQVDSQDFIFTFSFGAEEVGRLFIFSHNMPWSPVFLWPSPFSCNHFTTLPERDLAIL